MIPSQYSNTILSDSPALYYRLGETSGSTAFDSSNNRNGTINGGVTLGAQGAIKKDRDIAMLFDGTSGYIASGYNTGALSALSVECWLNLNNSSLAAYPAIATNDLTTSSNKGFEFFVAPASDGASGYFAIGFGASHVTLAFGSGALAPWTWYHLVAVYDGSHMFVYVNGQQIATTTASGTVAAPTYDIQIARYASDSGYLPATLDEFAFYAIALSSTRILAHYNTGTNTLITSSQDTFLNKFQLIKVYDTSGNFIDVIRDAPYLSGFKENINAAADVVRVVLPRRIDAYDGQYQVGSKNTLVLGNNVQWWLYGAGLPASGLLKYSGVIDTITPKLDESGGETVELLITPYSQILGDHAITSTVTFGTAGSSGTYIDTGQILQSFFTGSYIDSSGTKQTVIDAITGNPYIYPYTLDPMSTAYTGNKVQFAFQNQNILSTISNILLLSPANYYIRMNQNKIAYFGQLSFIPKYTLRLGQHISTIEFPSDNVPRKNVDVLQGKGVQGKYTGSSVSSLGQRVYFKSDNRITDATVAQDLANGLGAVYDQTVIRAKIKIPDFRGDQQPGLGYDIEQFKVGETLKIVDARAPTSSITGQGSVWGSSVWGRDKWGAATPQPSLWGSSTWGSSIWGSTIGAIFNQVVAIQTIEYGYFYVILEVGFRSPTLSRKLYDVESRLNDATLVS